MFDPRRSIRGLALCLVMLALASAGSYRVTASRYSGAFNVITRDGHEVRWTRLPVRYTVCPAGTPDIKADGDDGYGPPLTAQQAVVRAYETWAAVPGTSVSVKYDGAGPCSLQTAEGKNAAFWVTRGWQQLPFSPPAGALAVTITTFYPQRGEMVSGVIHFNNQYFRWANINSAEEESGRAGPRLDIQSVATHEIGHVLGLDHSSENPNEPQDRLRQATMYYASHTGDLSPRVLKEDDIAGLRHIYPAQAVNNPRVDTLTPAAGLGGAAGGTVEVALAGSDFSPQTHLILTRDGFDLQGVTVRVEANALSARLDLRGAPEGEYDLLISNAPEAVVRKNGAFRVVLDENELASLQQASGGGGCGTAAGREPGLVAVALALSLLGLRSRRFARARCRRPPAS